MPYKTTPKLSAALDEFLLVRASHAAPSTIANDRSLLRRFVAGVGDTQTHLLATSAVELWFAAEAGRQKATSYNKCRSRVIGFVAFLVRRGWMTTDVMGEIRPRRVQRVQRLQLTVAQLRELIEGTVNPRDRGMLAMGANTGLRASDLTSLKVGDVKLDRGVIRVEIQKTGDVDELPITSDLADELRIWLRWYTERLAIIGLPLQADYLLFPALGHRNVRRAGVMESYGDPQPNKRLSHPARVVHRALLRIGIEATAQEGFHTLRRSVGRAVFDQAAAEGHDGALRLTAALLGHRSTQTTELYLGINADRIKRNELLKGRSFLGTQDAPNVHRLSS